MWYKWGKRTDIYLLLYLLSLLFALHSWSLKELLWLMVQLVYCMVMQDITKLSVMEWLEATFKLSLLICWPLIVAGLLPAAVESHHSVAFTPHILADHPLSGVAGTSPEKSHSFFQLHSVEKEKHTVRQAYECLRMVLSRRLSFQWVIRLCTAEPCMAAATRHTMIFSRHSV